MISVPNGIFKETFKPIKKTSKWRKVEKGVLKFSEMKTHSLEELKDQNIGKSGKPKREFFKQELWIKLIGEAIGKVRKAKDLALEQLGELVGSQKSQITKIENSTTDARFSTVLRGLEAIMANVNFKLVLEIKK